MAQDSAAQRSDVGVTVSAADRCVSPPPPQLCASTAQRPICDSPAKAVPAAPISAAVAIATTRMRTLIDLPSITQGSPRDRFHASGCRAADALARALTKIHGCILWDAPALGPLWRTSMRTALTQL